MTVDRPSPGDGHVRVGTVHRERALTELRNAAADDRITFDELDARVARALQAQTRDDLAGVLGDLLTPPGWPRSSVTPPARLTARAHGGRTRSG